MNILAIISSNRKRGHTSKIVSILKEQVEKITKKNQDIFKFETIFLGDFEINHCKGCRTCIDHGEELCPWKDDVPLIKSKIKEANAIIFASPVYVGDVSSSMKALLDRLAYMCHRQEFYKKCIMILATTNATSLKRTIHTISASTFSWGSRLVATKGFKTFSSNDSRDILNNRYHKKISKLARKLYSGIKNKIYLKPSMISLAVFKLQQKHRADPELSSTIDYKYWKKQGWTNPKNTYYIDHNTGLTKIFFSKILYGILSLIF